MSFISDNLIHFLGRAHLGSPKRQFQVFRSIMENGLRAGQIEIKYPDGGLVHNQVVCFTDIPLSECDEHTSIYGKFGIGFKKSYIKKMGGNPARYFVDFMPVDPKSARATSRGHLNSVRWQQFRFLLEIKDRIALDSNFTLSSADGSFVLSAKKLSEFVENSIHVASFDKECGDLGPARDDTIDIDKYYKEREWRLVPSEFSKTAGSVSFSEDDGAFYYTFRREDVNMIVTPNEEIRSEVQAFFFNLKSSNNARLLEFFESPPAVVNYDDLRRW